MKTRKGKHLKYAKKIGPNDPWGGEWVVEGNSVIEVHHSPWASETVVFRGCDQGSAHAVAQALARYWSSGGDWRTLGPFRNSYEHVPRSRRAVA